MDGRHHQPVALLGQGAGTPRDLFAIGHHGAGLRVPPNRHLAGSEIEKGDADLAGHLGRGGFGEGDCHHSFDDPPRYGLTTDTGLAVLLPTRSHTPDGGTRYKQGRFAGAGARHNDNRAIKLALSRAPGSLVGSQRVAGRRFHTSPCGRSKPSHHRLRAASTAESPAPSKLFIHRSRLRRKAESSRRQASATAQYEQ